MNNHLGRRLFTRVVLTAALGSPPGHLLVAQDNHVIMQRYVASQALTEVALRVNTRPPRVNPGAIQLERVAGIAGGLDLWRATLPSDHSHPYLLARLNGKVIRLGGFTAPDLWTVASQLAPGGLDAERARAFSEQLALLADPNGAIQWIYVEKADQPAYVSKVASAWKKRAPGDWPRDTVMANEAGWTVQLTMLSRDTRSYTLHWVPLALSFDFDRDGRLLTWAQRAGELFGVTGVPVLAPGS